MFYVNARLPGSRDYIPIFDPNDKELIILAPKLTVEMGKAGSFQFQVPSTHQYYNQLLQLRTIVTVMLDDIEIFRGRVLTNKRSFNNLRTVYCEGDLSYLLDSVQKGQKFNGKLGDLFTRVINEHNERVNKPKRFEVGTISNSLKNRSVVLLGKNDSAEDVESTHFDYMQIAIDKGSDNWDSTFDFIQSVMIDYAGGYLRTRYNEEENKTYIDYLDLADYTSASTQPIEFGVNMLDLTEEIDAEDVFTVLIPLGDDNLTIAKAAEIAKNSDGSNIYHLSGSDELVDGAGVNTYGRIVKTNTFSGVTKPATLLENAKRFIENHENMPTTFTIKAVDMHFVDPSTKPIQIGDKVSVISAPHDIGENDEGFVCSKIEYDLSNPANNAFTFGIPKQTLTDRYKKDKKKTQRQSRERTRSTAAATSTAAVTEATTTAAEDTKTQLADFARDWMGYEIDDESRTVTLWAVSDWIEQMRSKLGILFDTDQGKIEIFSVYEDVKGLEKSRANIMTTADAMHAQIDLLTRYTNATGDEHQASISMWANEMKSAIEMKADRITLDAMLIELHATKDIVNEFGETLNHRLGIDLNADSGTIDIFNYATFTDADGNTLAESLADITTTADETHAQIDLLTRFTNATGDAHEASISMWANEMESVIEMKADRITLDAMLIELHATKDIVNELGETLNHRLGIDLNADQGTIDIFNYATFTDADGNTLSESLADITTTADETHAQIDLLTRFTNATGDEHQASIKMWADATESAIEMKADRVSIEAVQVAINTVSEQVNELGETLRKKCGIDVNADLGSVDLYSINDTVNEDDIITKRNEAWISLNSSDTEASILNYVGARHSDWTEEKKQRYVRSLIRSLKVKNPVTGKFEVPPVALTKYLVDENGTSINTVAQNIDLMANTIGLKAGEKISITSGKEIDIKTAIVKIDSDVVTVNNLVANKLSVSDLEATDGKVGTLYIKNNIYSNEGDIYAKKGTIGAKSFTYYKTEKSPMSLDTWIRTDVITQSFLKDKLDSVYAKKSHTHSISGAYTEASGYPSHQHKITVTTGTEK